LPEIKIVRRKLDKGDIDKILPAYQIIKTEIKSANYGIIKAEELGLEKINGVVCANPIPDVRVNVAIGSSSYFGNHMKIHVHNQKTGSSAFGSVDFYAVIGGFPKS